MSSATRQQKTKFSDGREARDFGMISLFSLQ